MKTARTFIVPLIAAALAASATLTSSAASVAPTSAHRDGDVVKWHRKEGTARLPVGPEMIPGAPHSFRKFSRQQLRESWVKELGHKPACKSAPTMTVRSLRTDGFAWGTFGTYPRPGCPTGGGYVAYWAIRNGEWKEVIGTQDTPSCDRLEQVGFPSELGVHQCFDGHDVVEYSHP
jgi:hypothetical protein